MPFVKAEPRRVRLKASLYGAHGTGKTFTSLLFGEAIARWRGGRLAFVDTEHGTKGADQTIPERETHPDAFDFDVLHTRSLSEILAETKALDPAVHAVVVIDSMSHIWDAAKEAWEAKNPGKEDIPLRAWGSIKRPYKELMRWVVESPFDVLIVGREKNVFGEGPSGELTRLGVAMRAEGETQFEPDLCFRMSLVGERGKDAIPSLFVEKDRYGVLQGRTYSKPNGDTISALFPYLGTETVQSDSDDERAEKDAELLTSGEDKAEKKRAKSVELLNIMQARIAACASVQDVAAVYDEMKKQKRYLIEEHVGVLRALYEEKRREVVEAAVPGV